MALFRVWRVAYEYNQGYCVSVKGLTSIFRIFCWCLYLGTRCVCQYCFFRSGAGDFFVLQVSVFRQPPQERNALHAYLDAEEDVGTGGGGEGEDEGAGAGAGRGQGWGEEEEEEEEDGEEMKVEVGELRLVRGYAAREVKLYWVDVWRRVLFVLSSAVCL